MTKEYAVTVLKEMDGRQYQYIKDWGLSTVQEAVRTLNYRKNLTREESELQERIQNKLFRKW